MSLPFVIKTLNIQDGFTFITKENCSYCVKAKNILSTKQYREIKLEALRERNDFDELYKAFKSHGATTFPIIYHDKKFIGGYIEMITFLAKQI